jgi:hypothetical protein
MDPRLGTCPLARRQLIEEYFIEHRTKVLDLAAFLDRLDRARDLDAADDFRLVALRRALETLCADEGPSRLDRVQMILSDTRTDLLEHLDRKSAFGAYPAGQRGDE